MFKKMLTGSVLVAAVALAGCGNKDADELLSQMKGFKDKACACKDAACADKVQEEMLGWAMKMAEKYKDKEPPKGSKSQEEEAKKINEEMQKCMEKAKGGGEAPPAADAPK